jgi:LysR family transcriptional regulator for metE and metH
MIERIHLLIVRELDREGSLTAAADRLCLTQSALSHSIRKLEERLGTALWRREGKRLVPTEAGNYMLSLANRLLPQLEHAEERLCQFARGERGSLRIGMECHPCYQWLLKQIDPYLAQWLKVEIDVKQKFQFGGIGALFAFEIDVLVTPDPLYKPGLHFEPVFDYEQVLVVWRDHPMAQRVFVTPADLAKEVLLTYPVPPERLDVFNQFLTPAGISPRQIKTVEDTEVLLQLVASQRGVAAMPRWLVDEYATRLTIAAVRLGRHGIAKQIHLGVRSADLDVDYIYGFLSLSKSIKIPLSISSQDPPQTLCPPRL